MKETRAVGNRNPRDLFLASGEEYGIQQINPPAGGAFLIVSFYNSRIVFQPAASWFPLIWLLAVRPRYATVTNPAFLRMDSWSRQKLGRVAGRYFPRG